MKLIVERKCHQQMLSRNSNSPIPQMHVFGLWKEAGVTEDNRGRHRDIIQTPYRKAPHPQGSQTGKCWEVHCNGALSGMYGLEQSLAEMAKTNSLKKVS